MDDPFSFDNEFFRISELEAKEMSPHARQAIELSWMAFEDHENTQILFVKKHKLMCLLELKQYHLRLITKRFLHLQLQPWHRAVYLEGLRICLILKGTLDICKHIVFVFNNCYNHGV